MLFQLFMSHQHNFKLGICGGYTVYGFHPIYKWLHNKI
jgi:hypothetical protein